MRSMWSKSAKRIWQAPLWLAILTLFGLLSALLGTGIWYPVSWATLFIPLGVIIWFWRKGKSAMNKPGKI